MGGKMAIGRWRDRVQTANEFQRMAIEDEEAGQHLIQSGRHRHAIYFLIQAMEKYVRAKAFVFVDPRNVHIREMHRGHSVEEALQFLTQVIPFDKSIKDQISQQISVHLTRNLRYEHIHNNVRYPLYRERTGEYSVLEVGPSDSELIASKLRWLKSFLEDVDRFR